METGVPLFDVGVGRGYKWVLRVGSVFFTGLGLMMVWVLWSGRTQGGWAVLVGALLAAGFAAFGVACGLAVTRWRLRVWAARLEWRGVWRRKGIRWEDAAGFRWLPQNNLRIEGRAGSGARAVMFEMIFERRDEVMHWIAGRLPDLAREENEREMDALRADEALGMSEDQRLYRLSRLRNGARAVNLLFGGLAGAAMFYRGEWDTTYPWMMWALAAGPFVAVGLIAMTGGVVALDASNGSPRPQVAIAVLLPALVLAMRAMRDWSWLGVPGATFWLSGLALGAVLAAGIAWVARGTRQANPKARFAWVIFVAFALLHGVGVAAFINGRFDVSPERRESVLVIGTREKSGRSPEWMLRVRPGIDGEAQGELRISREVFRAVAVHERVVVVIREGRLGGALYRVEKEREPAR